MFYYVGQNVMYHGHTAQPPYTVSDPSPRFLSWRMTDTDMTETGSTVSTNRVNTCFFIVPFTAIKNTLRKRSKQENDEAKSKLVRLRSSLLA